MTPSIKGFKITNKRPDFATIQKLGFQQGGSEASKIFGVGHQLELPEDRKPVQPLIKPKIHNPDHSYSKQKEIKPKSKLNIPKKKKSLETVIKQGITRKGKKRSD